MPNCYQETYSSGDVFYQTRKRRGKDEHYYTGKLWFEEKGSKFLKEGFDRNIKGKTIGEN